MPFLPPMTGNGVQTCKNGDDCGMVQMVLGITQVIIFTRPMNRMINLPRAPAYVPLAPTLPARAPNPAVEREKNLWDVPLASGTRETNLFVVENSQEKEAKS